MEEACVAVESDARKHSLMIPSDVLVRWSGVLLLLLLLLMAPTAKACLLQHSHGGIVSISEGIPGSIYLHPGRNFSLLSLNFVMESLTIQKGFNRTIFLRGESRQLAEAWHRMDIFPTKNESDYPRMTIPPSNETWALICCLGYEIRELQADTRGSALWSYKCPDNSLGQLLYPDDHRLQARYVTFIVTAILVLVAVAVTMAVLVMIRQKRRCLSPPSDEPHDCSSADENADGEEQVPTDAPRPRTSSAAARGVPPAESHYLVLTSPPVIDEDEAGYVILTSKRQRAKTTKKETATVGHYANVQDAVNVENVYEELRL